MKADKTLDAIGLSCPMPVVKTKIKLQEMAIGQVSKVLADDDGLVKDLPAWCEKTGNEFLGIGKEADFYKGYVRRLK